MANLLDIQRRIRSVSDTRQITRAMKLVAAARLRRAQERALSARPYEQMLVSVLKSLVSRADVYDPQSGEPLHPLLAEREEKNSLLIVISSDRGLAGAFDSNIARAALRFVNQKAGLRLGRGRSHSSRWRSLADAAVRCRELRYRLLDERAGNFFAAVFHSANLTLSPAVFAWSMM